MAKSVETSAHRYPQNADDVFGNSVIVERICSFMSSEADLLNLRLVNHLFQEEATKQFRKVHKPIVLEEESRVKELLSLTNNRETLRPFPFSAFEVNVDLSQEILESFGMTIGPYITRYSFETRSSWLRYKTSEEIGGKVAMLLSHSKKLTDLHLDTVQDLYVSEEDRSRVPITFPHLQRFGISSENPKNSVVPHNVFPLVDLVVSRARNLNFFKIPLGLSTVRSRVLQYLADNRPNNLPYFLLPDHFTLEANSIPFLQQLMDLNLKFREISVLIESKDELEAQSFVQVVGTWLEMQRSCLTDLNISLNLPPTTTFRFPVLPVLKRLTIEFLGVPGLPSPPVLSFEINQFPSLQRLRLDRYRNSYGIFGSCSMPSVKELHLRKHRSPLANSSFHITFPNLTSLHRNGRQHRLEVLGPSAC